MNKKILIALAVGLVGVLYFMLNVRHPTGLSELNTTVLSVRYSDSAFSKIHKGMSVDSVIVLLGEPLHRAPSNGGYILMFSLPSGSGWYGQRIVEIHDSIVVGWNVARSGKGN